jgi:hypothetical protein
MCFHNKHVFIDSQCGHIGELQSKRVAPEYTCKNKTKTRWTPVEWLAPPTIDTKHAHVQIEKGINNLLLIRY